MIEIEEYNEKYAKEISDIILSNLYEINIKDHGKDIIDKISKQFTEEVIKDKFPKRTKCFIALKGNEVVGTISLDKFKGDITGGKYIILTVFVKIQNHGQGIGKILMQEVEKYVKELGIKEMVIFSSVYACEFYRKLGYDYLDGKKKQNEDKEYVLVKYFNK